MDEREGLEAFPCRKALSFRSWRIASRIQLLRLVDEVHLLLSWLIATRMQLLGLGSRSAALSVVAKSHENATPSSLTTKASSLQELDSYLVSAIQT